MRMIDKIYHEGVLLPAWFPEYSQGNRKLYNISYLRDMYDAKFDDAISFEVSNVADYTFNLGDRRFLTAKDFPNLAPPYVNFWVEFQIPKTLTDVERTVNIRNTMPISHYGYLFQSIKYSSSNFDIREFRKKVKYIDNKTPESGMTCDDLVEPEWVIGSSSFMYTDNCKYVIGPISHNYIFIDKFGHPIKIGDREYDYTSTLLLYNDRLTYDQQKSLVTQNLFIWPCHMAISFLHCKNVRIKSNEPKLTKKQIRRMSGRGLRYHTLEIEPMKRIIEREGDIEHNGLAKALHICRGHFKDYTKGMGLFGKHKGVYWWPDNVRGKSEAGIVVKDYAVKAKA